MHIISSSRAGARQWHFVSLTVPFQFCPVQPFSHIHKRAVLASIAHTYQQFSNPFRNRQCILSLPLLCILIGLNKIRCSSSFFRQCIHCHHHCIHCQIPTPAAIFIAIISRHLLRSVALVNIQLLGQKGVHSGFVPGFSCPHSTWYTGWQCFQWKKFQSSKSV